MTLYEIISLAFDCAMLIIAIITYLHKKQGKGVKK